jgi:hypothetical protein
MTEEEWMASNDPHLVLREAKASQYERKSRLISVAFANRVLAKRNDPHFCRALEIAERHADGQAEEWEVSEACSRVNPFTGQYDPDPILIYVFKPIPLWTSRHATLKFGSDGAVKLREEAAHCQLVRDVYGNPFRPITFNPSWLTSTVIALARQMYDSRDFSAMPILADALQDAGCDDAAILDHCRDAKGVHVRGCWIVDQILGFS